MNSLRDHTIIFFPGMDGSGISFEPLGRLIPNDVHIKVIRYPEDRFFSFEETVQCAKDQIGDDRKNVIVIAESFSGPVAVALVGSGELRAECLILCSTFARSPRPLLLEILGYLPLDLLINIPFPRIMFRYLVKGGDEAADLFFTMWRKVKAFVPSKVLVHRLEIINHIDVRMWLPKITVPCLYIQASLDRSVPASCLFDFTENIADLRVKRIRGPHFILQARPEASLNAIQDFVRLITSQ